MGMQKFVTENSSEVFLFPLISSFVDDNNITVMATRNQSLCVNHKMLEVHPNV
jgi:hypothetical protein